MNFKPGDLVEWIDEENLPSGLSKGQYAIVIDLEKASKKMRLDAEHICYDFLILANSETRAYFQWRFRKV